MKNRIRALIVLNIIYYTNNLLYAVTKVRFGVSGILELWAFSPFFLIFLTTFVAEDNYRKIFNKIKNKARMGVALRIIAMFMNFYMTGFKFGEFWFGLMIFLELFIMGINIYLEVRMYNISDKFTSDNIALEDELLSKKEVKGIIKDYYFGGKVKEANLSIWEKKERRDNFKIISLAGYSRTLLYTLIILIAPGVRFAGENYRIFMLLMILIIFNLYISITYKKIRIILQRTSNIKAKINA